MKGFLLWIVQNFFLIQLNFKKKKLPTSHIEDLIPNIPNFTNVEYLVSRGGGDDVLVQNYALLTLPPPQEIDNYVWELEVFGIRQSTYFIIEPAVGGQMVE